MFMYNILTQTYVGYAHVLTIDSLWKLPDGCHIDMLGMLMYIMYKKCLKISKGKESAYKSTDIFLIFFNI